MESDGLYKCGSGSNLNPFLRAVKESNLTFAFEAEFTRQVVRHKLVLCCEQTKDNLKSLRNNKYNHMTTF